MKNQVAVCDIDGLISTLCEDFPTGLRQIADAIDAKRISGRYHEHIAHGFSAKGFGLRITFYLDGNLVLTERAPEMLESGG